MAVTADVIAVDLIATDKGYAASMGNARRSLLALQSAGDDNANALTRRHIPAFTQAKYNSDLYALSLRRLLLQYVGFRAVIEFAKSILATGDALRDTADQLGLTTQELQGLNSAALDTGAGAERLKQALGTLTDNLGDATKGEGNLAKMMRELNIPLGTTMQVMFDLADRVKAASTQNEKMAISTTAFGRAGKSLVPILQDGADGLRRHLEEAQKKGQIWDPETVKKLDAASDSLERLKVTLIGKFADPFANVVAGLDRWIKTITSDEFGAALDKYDRIFGKAITFGLYQGNTPESRLHERAQAAGIPFAGPAATPSPGGRTDVPLSKAERDRLAAEALARRREIAATSADAAKAAAALVTVIDAANSEIMRGTLGAFGAIRKQIDSNAAAELQAIDAELTAKIEALDKEKLGRQAYNTIVNNLNDDAASKESAIIVKQRADHLQAARDEIEARYQVAAAIDETRRNTVRSEHDMILELARGKQDYYKIARELSDEDAKLEEENIRDRLAHELANLERQKVAADKSGQSWADYENERTAATTKAELEIEGLHNQAAANAIRLDEDRNRALQDQIAIMDNVRGGLEDIGAAALQGGDAFKRAIVDMITQLATLSLRLYILKPLIRSVFGSEGTDAGILNQVLGLGGGGYGFPDSVNVTPGKFARGGRPPKDRISIVGENGPEYFRPDSAGTIYPNIPNISANRKGMTLHITNHNSFAGAIGIDSIKSYADQVGVMSANAAFSQMRKNLPGMMVTATQRSL